MSWNAALALTALRGLLGIPILVLILQGRLQAALAVFILAVLTDKLDGIVARAYRLQSELGKRLDPLADAFLVGLTLVPLIATGRLGLLILLTIPAGLLGLVVLACKAPFRRAWVAWTSEAAVPGKLAFGALYAAGIAALASLPTVPFELLAIATALLANAQWFWRRP
jgi:phosphatidylglycerophosphate synthase